LNGDLPLAVPAGIAAFESTLAQLLSPVDEAAHEKRW